jgi:hypothetical protein
LELKVNPTTNRLDVAPLTVTGDDSKTRRTN